MSGVTDFVGGVLIAAAVASALILAAGLADATDDYRVTCPEMERNTDQCRTLAGEVIVNDGYEFAILGLFPTAAIGGALVLYGGMSKRLTCGKCGYTWDYGGKSEYYATCPRCLRKVKVLPHEPLSRR